MERVIGMLQAGASVINVCMVLNVHSSTIRHLRGWQVDRQYCRQTQTWHKTRRAVRWCRVVPNGTSLWSQVWCGLEFNSISYRYLLYPDKVEWCPIIYGDEILISIVAHHVYNAMYLCTGNTTQIYCNTQLRRVQITYNILQVPVLPWPVYLLALSLIEHSWDILNSSILYRVFLHRMYMNCVLHWLKGGWTSLTFQI